jgi:two-component system phosphate regulon sensor histidine kinase PhoR
MRLRSRFLLLFLVLAIAAAYSLTRLFDARLRVAIEDRVVERLTREAAWLGEQISRHGRDPAAIDADLRRAASSLNCRITLVLPDGRVAHETRLAPSEVAAMENHSDREEIREARLAGVGASRRYSENARSEMFYVARRLPSGQILRLAVTAGGVEAVEEGYLWAMRLVVWGVCLGLFAIGAILSRRFAAPISEITRAASAVAAGEFQRDLPTSGGPEVRDLANALRKMKDSLAKARERAEEQRRLTALVFERLPDGLVVVDERLHVLEVNERFARMIGSPAPVGRALYDLLRDRRLFEIFEQSVATRELQERLVHLSEEQVWSVIVQPLPRGSEGAAVGVLRDVTRLERTEAMRRTFVADVSHELRTPIASVAAAAETLAEGEPEVEEQASLVAVIRRQSEHMRELIDDLMDLAQIESGSVPLEHREVELVPLLREVAEELESAARERDVTLRVVGDERAQVFGDRRRLGQVARNLLDNAIKFSPPGAAVELSADVVGASTSFSVRDHGPGIPRPERDRIFQRFYQVDRSRSKVRPGSGLGLAIVKHLAHLHGATVEVESEPGQGSIFRVRFPAG